jgi:hypothetical protein
MLILAILDIGGIDIGGNDGADFRSRASAARLQWIS